MRETIYDIKLGSQGFNIDRTTYKEVGPGAKTLPREMYQAATGELDFESTWPYHQRSWLLGEQQYFTHEFDEMKNTAVRRYQSGQGLDASTEGQLGLLSAVSRTLALTTNPTTCPLITSKDGASVYAFPAGETKMYKYTTSWDAGETITSVTAPVLDAYMGGNGEIYIIDSNASGSRVLKRTTGGTWSRVTPTTGSITDGNDEVYTNTEELALDQKRLCKIPVSFTGSTTTLKLFLDGAGSGAGNQVCKAVVFTDVDGAPGALLGTSAEVTVTDAQAAGYVTFTFTSFAVTAGYVWVGLIGGANTLTIRWYYTEAAGPYACYNTDAYAGGAEATWSGGTMQNRLYSAVLVVSYVLGGWATTAYNDATAVVWINGELYVVTPDQVYCHTLDEEVSPYCGGSIACTHDGAMFWSDGSNKVYEYNGVGVREIVGQLPPGFTIQCLFSAHSRMWICGKLANGDAGVYWYAQGMYGILAHFPAASGAARNVYAGAATDEYVVFSDSRYGGTIRHYVPEGGWSHYLAYGTATAIPYKGMTTAAGKTFVALATAAAGTQGIYSTATTYVASGVLTSSQMDLQMPAHEKRWTALILSTLPLRAGEKILVEVSADGGRTWETKGRMEDVNQTVATFYLDYRSPTIQYRLTLYAGTSAATDPKILSVVTRALPIIENGRQWAFRIRSDTVDARVSGKVVADDDARVRALLDEVNISSVLDFTDVYGDAYKVTVKYQRVPAYDSGATRTGSLIDVELQEERA